MINISNTLKQACNSNKLTYREYVVLSGTTTQIDVMIEMYATAYKDTHFIGSFNMKYIKFTTSNDVKYRNKELTLYKEINGESFKVGNFIVTEIKDNDSTEEVKVTAYDYGLKFAQPYVTGLDYASGNVTLKDVLDEICNNVGVELVNTNLTNGDFIVDSNQFVNGEMFGDVISAIAFISGNFATITNDDKLELIFTKETDEIIEDYVELEDKRDTRPITSLSIGTSQVQGQNAVIKDEVLIEQYGEHWLEINDVPFAYTLEKREQLKQAIFDKVKGFGYSSFKSEYAFKPYLTLGDLIQFRNKEGQLVNSIVLKITSKYDEIILEAPSVTDATVEYENPKNAYDIAKRAEIIANQSSAEIISITTTITNDIYTKTQTNELVQNSVDGLVNAISVAGGNNYIKDSMGVLNDGSWTNIASVTDTFTRQNAVGQSAIMLQDTTSSEEKSIKQEILCKNGIYTISFEYLKLLELAICKIIINDVEYYLEEYNSLTQFSQTINVSSGKVRIEFISDEDNSCYIVDLMMNDGEEVLNWSQNANETITDTVKIGKGIEVASNTTNTIARIDSDGSRVLNKTTGEVVREDTDKGTVTNQFESRSTSKVNGLLVLKSGNQVWLSGV
ncbi:MAG: hypothetical protein UHK60_11190 [Acutalibacteraceae bacterium]|nr:hypothetical protein [Acutalibacteraceae bacterium]